MFIDVPSKFSWAALFTFHRWKTQSKIIYSSCLAGFDCWRVYSTQYPQRACDTLQKVSLGRATFQPKALRSPLTKPIQVPFQANFFWYYLGWFPPHSVIIIYVEVVWGLLISLPTQTKAKKNMPWWMMPFMFDSKARCSCIICIYYKPLSREKTHPTISTIYNQRPAHHCASLRII